MTPTVIAALVFAALDLVSYAVLAAIVVQHHKTLAAYDARLRAAGRLLSEHSRTNQAHNDRLNTLEETRERRISLGQTSAFRPPVPGYRSGGGNY